jgi:Kef-type K+ transport system membrane component KefB
MRRPHTRFQFIAMGLALAAATTAVAHAGPPPDGPLHVEPFAFVMLAMAFVITVAMAGHWLAEKLQQPPVLGELLIGVIVGNAGCALGVPLSVLIMHLGEAREVFHEFLRSGDDVVSVATRVLGPESVTAGGVMDQLLTLTAGEPRLALVYAAFALSLFSSMGVLLLTFMVGLQSSIKELRSVGANATRVAVVGILAPFVLGLGMAAWLLPEAGSPVHLFVAATLCATSVGITARVFMDMDRLHTPEARVILGAAVIDDVLGLILLAVVSGIAATGQLAPLDIARVLGLSLLFLGAVVLFGERLGRSAAHLFEDMDRQQGKLLFPIALAFALAWAASEMSLAPIVGAFAAGLIISDKYFHHAEQRWSLDNLVEPLESIFAPVFFVLMGMQVNLAVFGDPATLVLAGTFTTVAVVGKLVAGAVAGDNLDRLTVGFGMVPRGEVGLIFASIGRSLGVIEDRIFTAMVIMVVLTTFTTPLALRWSTTRQPAATGHRP